MVQDDKTNVVESGEVTSDDWPEPSSQRSRSEIAFPYSDLESAVGLARALHLNAGSACDDAELAVWMNMSEAGGTYRARRGAARMFGLVDLAQGRLSLTTLGRRVTDEADRGALVDAFLKPALFAALYDQYRGQTLPPQPTIERHVERLGVPPKQIRRARQVFQTSAHYAGFVDPTSGRFRKPGIGPSVSDPTINKAASNEGQGGGSGGDGGGGDIDPIILGLLARLPKSGSVWPEAQRKLWLELLAGSFKLIYEDASPSDGQREAEQ